MFRKVEYRQSLISTLERKADPRLDPMTGAIPYPIQLIEAVCLMDDAMRHPRTTHVLIPGHEELEPEGTIALRKELGKPVLMGG